MSESDYKYTDQLNEMETLKVEPESILVYIPAEKKSNSWYERMSEYIENEACRALRCDPKNLPIGIIILEPGDRLETLPSKKLLDKIVIRLKKIEEKVGK